MAPTTPPGAQSTGTANNADNEKPASVQHPAPLPSSSSSSVNDHLAQALQDLARGEQTASALENNLSNLESKLDDLLASFGISAADLDALGDDDDEKEPLQKDGEDGVGGKKGGTSGKGGEGEGKEGKGV